MPQIPDGIRTVPHVSPMAQVERKMGVKPIEDLLAERELLVQRVADLRARFGPGGTWDALRKTELSKIAAVLRAEAGKVSRKITEAQLDQEAHADPRYIEFLTTATRQRAEWTILEDEIQGINEIIMRGQAVCRFTTAEAHL